MVLGFSLLVERERRWIEPTLEYLNQAIDQGAH
jgi:hypothetical protein